MPSLFRCTNIAVTILRAPHDADSTAVVVNAAVRNPERSEIKTPEPDRSRINSG
jgi:hypothetical protein